MLLGCTSSPGEQQMSAQSESTPAVAERSVLAKSVQDVVTARWHGFQSLAALPSNRSIVGVELIRTRQDETAAVFTIADHGVAHRYVVIGDAHGVPLALEHQRRAIAAFQVPMNALNPDGSADPAFVAIAHPPPEEPTRPGIATAAEDLLATVFDSESLALGRRTHPPLSLGSSPRLVTTHNGDSMPSVYPATLSDEVEQVMAARWEGFRSLARQLPNHATLAVELLRTRQDETLAVFTVVENGALIKYASRGDLNGRAASRDQAVLNQGVPSSVLVADDGSIDPSIVAVGHPPPLEPTRPGIVAVGEALLSVAFNADEEVDTSR